MEHPVDDLRSCLEAVAHLLKKGDDHHHQLPPLVLRLANKYLASPDTTTTTTTRSRQPPTRTTPDAASTLVVLAKFANQLPAAFAYGSPDAVGPILLILLARIQLHEHDLLLEALFRLLSLLRAGSARVHATFGRECLGLLELLSTTSVAQPPVSLPGFGCLAAACCAEPPRSLCLHDESQVMLVRVALLRLAARTHAEAAQFLGDGGPRLWGALERALEHALAAGDLAAVTSALHALSDLLGAHMAPAVHGQRLLRTLLALLCAVLPADAERAALLDEAGLQLIGSCLLRLAASPSAPPMASLAPLLDVMPRALKGSKLHQLHAALGKLYCLLPVPMLAARLEALEPLLGDDAAHDVAAMCFERVLRGESAPPARATESSTPLIEPLHLAFGSHGRKRRCVVVQPAAPADEAVATVRSRLLNLALKAEAEREGILASLSAEAGAADHLHSVRRLMAVASVVLAATTPDKEEEVAADGAGRSSAAQDLVREQIVTCVSGAFVWVRERITELRARVVANDAAAEWSRLLRSFHACLSLVENRALIGRHVGARDIPVLLADDTVRLAALPWQPDDSVLPDPDADPRDGNSGHRLRRGWTCRFPFVLQRTALSVLLALPHASAPLGAVRLGAFEAILADAVGLAALETDAAPLDEKADVLKAALEALPLLVAQAGWAQVSGCLLAVRDLVGASLAAPTVDGKARHATFLAGSLGMLACLEAGCCRAVVSAANGGSGIVCDVCDRALMDEAAATASGGGRDEPMDVVPSESVGASQAEWHIFTLLPQLWSLLTELPSSSHSQARAALVRALSRLARHATPEELVSSRAVMVHLVGMLADGDPEVSAACAESLPLLLGRDDFVRAVGGLDPSQPLGERELARWVIQPMAQTMAERAQLAAPDEACTTAASAAAAEGSAACGGEPRLLLVVMEALCSIARQPLYRGSNCRAAVILALSRHLVADTLSLEHATAMRLLRSLASTAVDDERDGFPHATPRPRDSLAWLCQRLAPQLFGEWAWWAIELPRLLSPVAELLLDWSERELLQHAVPHILPDIVLRGGLFLKEARDDGSSDARSAAAGPLLKLLAERLDTSPAKLLINHMHLILAELFITQAADDTGELNKAIPGGLDFMVAAGVARELELAEMVQMCAQQLLHEMVLRLGRAEDGRPTQIVLMALNILIAFGLRMGGEDVGATLGSAFGSNAINESNTALRSYVDDNFHMLVQPLRKRVASQTLLLDERRVALRALEQLLVIMDGSELGQPWWSETVAMLKLVLAQSPLQSLALRVLHRFSSLLEPELLVSGLQQLVLITLPCLSDCAQQVARILESLVVEPLEKGEVSPMLDAALRELTILPDHPALDHVRRTLEINYARPSSLRDRLQPCARALRHDSAPVRHVALKQLASTLCGAPADELAALTASSTPADQQLTSELMRELLASLRHTLSVATPAAAGGVHHEEAAELALQCLGVLGALDPALVDLGSASAAARSSGLSAVASSSAIPREPSNVLLSVQLIEGFLVGALREAAEGQVVQSAAYAIGELLRNVCQATPDTPSRYMAWAEEQPEAATAVASAANSGLMGDHRSRTALRYLTSALEHLDDDESSAIEAWAMLSESTRRAVLPYLALAAERRGGRLGREFSPGASIWTRGMAYKAWLTRWCRVLMGRVAHLRESAEATLPAPTADCGSAKCGRLDEGIEAGRQRVRRATLLLACEPSARHDTKLALHLLPYLMHSVLSFDEAEADSLLSEMISVCGNAGPTAGDEASDFALFYQAIFSAIDTLETWSFAASARKDALAESVLRRLLDRLPFQTFAKAALRAGFHARAVRLLESQSDAVAPPEPAHYLSGKCGGRRCVDDSAGSLYHRAYYGLREADELLGLSRMRPLATLDEEALEHELHGRYGAALSCYQAVLQEPGPARDGDEGRMGGGDKKLSHAEAQLGICRSLQMLGLYTQIMDCARGALSSAASPGGVDTLCASPSGDESLRLQLSAGAAAAAWRLSSWGDVRHVLSASGAAGSTLASPSSNGVGAAGVAAGEASYELALAHALLALRANAPQELAAACSGARRALAPLLAAASMESYSHTFPHLVRLQALQELQAAAPVVNAFGALSPTFGEAVAHADSHLREWEERPTLCVNEVRALEPVVALRSCVAREVSAAAEAAQGTAGQATSRLNDTVRRVIGEGWLQIAKASRAAGNHETAANALVQARPYVPYAAVLMSAKIEWEAGRTHHAIGRLEQQMLELTHAVEAVTDPEGLGANKEALARTIVRLARFLGETGESEAAELQALYHRATDLCPSWEKAHHWLGRFHDAQLRRALGLAAQSEVAVESKSANRMSCPSKRSVSAKEKQEKARKAYAEHLSPLICACGAALMRGVKHAPSVLPRVLTLWLDYANLVEGSSSHADSGAPFEHFESALVERLPSRAWLPCIAQLVSRVCHRNARARKALLGILARLLADYPQQLVWAVTPLKLSTVAERRQCGESIFADAHRRLGASSLKIKVLGTAPKLVELLRQVCNDSTIDKTVKRVSIRGRWSGLHKLHSLPLVVPVYGNLTAREQAPAFSTSRTTMPRDGRFPALDDGPYADDAPTIDRWEDQVEVMGSLQRPKKVMVRGSDGVTYPFLCKPKDDLRKDARMMDFMTCVNRLLRKSPVCRARRLATRCYAVTPLDQECGLIEWVPHMLQLRSIIKAQWDSRKLPFAHKDIKERHTACQQQRGERKVRALSKLCLELMGELPPVLHHWLAYSFREPAAWFDARLSFARSCALMSIIGYAVGLGDRHLENILVHACDGSLMHVDFACLFDHGRNLATPERVPFRLTQNLVHAMGICGVEGGFRATAELALSTMRTHREVILHVLSTMRHDPLVEWKKRNQREDTTGQVDSEEADKELAKIDLKLQGVIEGGTAPVSVQGQVRHLINEATSLTNLSQMYVWWMPFV